MAEIAGLAGFSDKECDKICLAVDEACSNIIRHAYKERTDGEIILNCRIEPGTLRISIRDFGEKFDARQIEPRDPDDVKPGGLGVHMIRTVMDEVEYDCSHETGTELRMAKFARPTKGSGEG
jgi:anti-sigma regulatory factor (Ser/Thr protein kinase)